MCILILAPAEAAHLTASLPDEGPEEGGEDAEEEDEDAIERFKVQPLQGGEHATEEDGQGDVAQGREAGEVVSLDEVSCEVTCMAHRGWKGEGGRGGRRRGRKATQRVCGRMLSASHVRSTQRTQGFVSPSLLSAPT